MPPRRRRLLGITLPLALFVLLLRPIVLGEQLAMRELFRLAMSLGLLPPTGSFWGQIYGLNIPMHSEAFHLLVRTLAGMLVFAPLCAACLLVWYWVRISPPMGARRLRTGARLAIVAGLATLMLAFFEPLFEGITAALIFRAGKAAGCEYVIFGVIFAPENGPFIGGYWAGLFNALYLHGPWIFAHTLPFALAWIAFAWLSRRDPRPRAGQCPACGYPLAGLEMCPECGLAVRPGPG